MEPQTNSKGLTDCQAEAEVFRPTRVTRYATRRGSLHEKYPECIDRSFRRRLLLLDDGHWHGWAARQRGFSLFQYHAIPPIKWERFSFTCCSQLIHLAAAGVADGRLTRLYMDRCDVMLVDWPLPKAQPRSFVREWDARPRQDTCSAGSSQSVGGPGRTAHFLGLLPSTLTEHVIRALSLHSALPPSLSPPFRPFQLAFRR